jgi:acyl carrier protein
MQQRAIEHKVYTVIAAQFAIKPENISPGWSLRDYLGADSMALVELITGLEEAFGMEMPEVAEDEITTVGDLVKAIQARL